MAIKLSDQAPGSPLLSQALLALLSAEPSESALAAVAGMRSATCIFAPPQSCNNGISALCHGTAHTIDFCAVPSVV